MYFNYKLLTIIISSLETNILFLLFQDNIYGRKFKSRTIYILLCIISSICLTILTLTGIPFINTFFVLIVLILTSNFFYESSAKRFMLYNTLLVILFVLVDLIVSAIFSIILSKSLAEMLGNDLFFLVSSLPVLLAHFISYYYFLKYIKKTKFDMANIIEVLLLLFTLLFEIFFLFYLTYSNINEVKGNYMILSISIGYGVLYIMQIYLFNKLSAYYQSQNNLKFQKLQSDLLYKHYIKLEQVNIQQSKTIHDIKNHINTLTALIDSDLNIEAQKYKEQINSSLKSLSSNYVASNSPLHLIINDKNNLCVMNNIDLKLYIEDSNIGFMDLYDLTTILGNIFDNAIFACKSLTSDKRIEFRLYEFGGHIVIYMNNSADPVIRTNNKGHILSSKKNHEAIGLKNINAVIKKYNGQCDYEFSPHDFTVKIIIPIP